ncbi:MULTISPECIES: hypothetical protein [Hyphomicrobiales]|uniref:hypothetical protein n=1 Tax=Hyphomicrobiales TaxID=356 RepID=UPI000C65DA16|nr:hypothetical protein [Martelella sp.]MAU22079.1 hypothetical protein [Martelella sp.]|tara:strand:- start:1474 stop:2538 length:1065 start_codon:yes stop_codon:yes gene_type:complete
MKWGDSKRDFDTVLAVWPTYEALNGFWEMHELAVSRAGAPKWRDRRIPTSDGGVKLDRYSDADAAVAASASLNARYASDLQLIPMEEDLRRSLQLKTSKALQAKERLHSEEALMLAEAKRRKVAVPALLASELQLTKGAEPFRQALAVALTAFPYVTGIRVGELRERLAMGKSYEGVWDVLANGSLHKRGATLIERSKIASGFDLNPTEHWGEVKAKIRQILLPRANKLLQLASVRRLLDEALARGEQVLVCSGVVFWYEQHGQVGWQVKTTNSGQSDDGTTLWTEGTIVSANHGRLVILPFVKENGEHVKGHTRNAPNDGPAKPRHSSQYVEIPFKVLSGDLMIGLFGELPYE